jgi:hemerythrin-like domain-containing protein
MDAIKMLKDDHKEVKALFRKYEKLGDDAIKTKQEIATKVFDELTVHASLEEEIFYPAVAAKADEEERDVILEGIEEHAVMKMLIAELRKMTPEDETFDAKFKVLTENTEHHIEEEEEEMLPNAKKLLGDDVETLGDEMDARKHQLQAAA